MYMRVDVCACVLRVVRVDVCMHFVLAHASGARCACQEREREKQTDIFLFFFFKFLLIIKNRA